MSSFGSSQRPGHLLATSAESDSGSAARARIAWPGQLPDTVMFARRAAPAAQRVRLGHVHPPSTSNRPMPARLLGAGFEDRHQPLRRSREDG